jgi:hypothetical protein
VSTSHTISKVKSGGELGAALPTINNMQGNYYFNQDGKKLSIYNSNLDLVYFYDIPSYAGNNSFFVLNNGNVLVQYTISKFNTDKKYDIIMNNTKYDLVQELINAKKCKVSKVSSKYYYTLGAFTREADFDMFNGLKGKFENIICGTSTKNDYIDLNNSAMLILAVGNDGKVQQTLNNVIEGQTSFSAISKDRIILRDINNREFLCDYKGKVIGEISNANDMTDKYVISDNAIYNMSLDKLIDFNSAENGNYNYYDTIGNNVLLSKNTTSGTVYAIYRDGKLDNICSETEDFNHINNDFYTVYRAGETDPYSLFNSEGTFVFRSSYAINNFNYGYLGDSKCCVLRIAAVGGNHYYLMQ